ncbi:glycosyltransferase family 4 protein [Paraburkholderia haematera]|uniref:glycosyltransferase family 4 protein n=1 Tax=Paraburkholderia haematera TaxID=2793077 RepID=UPI001B8D9E58|nr:glycosyltransferase family 1 protein [Paraburkholderia haematera]
MKLILAVDSIVPPLTGIGRYTWELAAHYQTSLEALDSMRFFLAGRWVGNPADLLKLHTSEGHAPKRKRRFLRPPQSWYRWRTRREMRGHVFHSPNYFLPDSVESGVVTVHDLSVFKYPETHPIARIKHFEQGFASTLARAAHLITDSEAIRREVIDYFGWSPERITAIGLGVRQEFHPRETSEVAVSLRELGLASGGYALCVSTLEPRKRIDRLLAAYLDLAPTLRARYPLVLVGSSGWLSEALQEQIKRGEQDGWLRYLGFVDETLLPLVYAGARAFLFPSIYEGFGLPVLEAMASGVPALTSNSSSLPEVAGGAAWLVEPDDHCALRDGIEHVLCDEGWREIAIQRGLQVANVASWEQCAKNTLDVCRRFA